MKEIIGKTITKLEIGEDNTCLVFTTSEGEKIFYESYGDCCSSSWFSNITGIKNLLGEKVIAVVKREEFSEEEQIKAEEQYKKDHTYEAESLSLYGFLVKTKRGTCDIEFRNESNGYYGGWCENISSLNTDNMADLKEITSDF